MDIENFVYYQKGGKVLSLGYEVDSPLLNKNLPALDSSCKNLAVPAGLFLLKRTVKPKSMASFKIEEVEDNPEVMSEDMYDSLLNLMNPKHSKTKKPKKPIKLKLKKQKTRRRRKSSKRKTRTKK